ncbi:MAG: response regulator transcription factor [Lachnospiraceae bacterium]|nr:response regulator transcription factor [Lachnospiraceae bacterium]MCI9369909.1 response regulator transcription factor [Lachnospiraceae bacterium]
MNIAIVEDAKEWTEKMKNVIQQTLKKEQTEIEIYSSAEEFLEAGKEYQIVFMDIYLNGISGLEATIEYKSQFSKSIVMIVTSYKEYCREGYKVEAFRFIEKDNLKEEMQEGLEHALTKLRRYQTIEVHVPKQGKVMLVYKDIIYIETIKQERKVIFHTTKQDYTAEEKITELTKRLEEDGFYRSNKSVLVNLDWVEKVSSDGIEAAKKIFLKNGKKVSLGVKKRKELMMKLYEWRLKQINQ